MENPRDRSSRRLDLCNEPRVDRGERFGLDQPPRDARLIGHDRDTTPRAMETGDRVEAPRERVPFRWTANEFRTIAIDDAIAIEQYDAPRVVLRLWFADSFGNHGTRVEDRTRGLLEATAPPCPEESDTLEDVESPPQPPAVPRTIAAGVVVTMLAVAFRHLATYDPTQSTTNLELEHYFFGTAATWPPLAIALAGFSLWQRRHHALAPGALLRRDGLVAVILGVLGLALLGWSRHTGALHLLAPAAALSLVAVCTAIGGRAARRAAYVPAAFLLFAAPIPPVVSNPIVYQLQSWTTGLLELTLSLAGADFVATGDLILRGDYTFEVIEACSGYRATLLLPLATLFYLELLGWTRPRAQLLLVLSPIVGFLWNTPRALSIVLGPESLVGRDHTIQGLLVTVLGVVTIAVLDVALQRAGVGRAVSPTRTLPPEVALPRTRFAGIAIGAALLIAVPPLVPRWEPEQRGPYALAGFPTIHPGWKRTSTKSDATFLGSILFDERVESRYTDAEGRWVEVFVAANHRLDASRTLISPRAPIPASGWEIVENSPVVDTAGTRDRVRLRVRREDRYAWVESWFEGLDGPAVEISRNALALDQSRLRRSESSFLVRIWTPEPPGVSGRAEALAHLESFATTTRDRLATANRTRFRSPSD